MKADPGVGKRVQVGGRTTGLVGNTTHKETLAVLSVKSCETYQRPLPCHSYSEASYLLTIARRRHPGSVGKVALGRRLVDGLGGSGHDGADSRESGQEAGGLHLCNCVVIFDVIVKSRVRDLGI